jgi:hypothetical protein
MNEGPSQAEAIVWTEHVSERVRFGERERRIDGVERILICSGDAVSSGSGPRLRKFSTDWRVWKG